MTAASFDVSSSGADDKGPSLHGHDTAILRELRAQQALHENRIMEMLCKHEVRVQKALARLSSLGSLAGGDDVTEMCAPNVAKGSGASMNIPQAWSGANLREEASSMPGIVPSGEGTSGEASDGLSDPKCGPLSGTDTSKSKQGSNGEVEQLFRITPGGQNSDDVDVEDGQGNDIQAKNFFLAMASRLSRNRHFEVCMAVMILLNAAIFGWQADWSIKHLDSAQPAFFTVTEYFFAIIFSFELLLRLMDEGFFFVSLANKNFMWNCFDSFIVASSWIEDVVRLILSTTIDVSALRIVRLLRLVRILRIIRVMRFFRELRLMVQGILVSLKPLLWCIVLLALVMFSVGMIILQVALIEIMDNPQADHSNLKSLFGGIITTMYTLYMSMTGGVDWGDPASELSRIHGSMSILYCFFIAFTVLCMLNIVTGVFVENANAITKSDADNMVMEEMAIQEKQVEEMRTLFGLAAGGQANWLQEQQFVEFSQERKVQAYFRNIGLHVEKENASVLFRLIDVDSDGRLTVGEFVEGCAQFIGNARQLDIARLRKESKKTYTLLREFITYMLENIATSEESLAAVHRGSIQDRLRHDSK
jgi:hypothetical protein